VPCGQHFKAEL